MERPRGGDGNIVNPRARPSPSLRPHLCAVLDLGKLGPRDAPLWQREAERIPLSSLEGWRHLDVAARGLSGLNREVAARVLALHFTSHRSPHGSRLTSLATKAHDILSIAWALGMKSYG